MTDFGPVESHEQALRRPAVILQIDELANLWTVVVVPLTTAMRCGAEAGTVVVPQGEAGLSHDSVALCYQIRALDRPKLPEKMGNLPPDRLERIEAQVAWICGITS
jgi:mRNA interferase MazF